MASLSTVVLHVAQDEISTHYSLVNQHRLVLRDMSSLSLVSFPDPTHSRDHVRSFSLVGGASGEKALASYPGPPCERRSTVCACAEYYWNVKNPVIRPCHADVTHAYVNRELAQSFTHTHTHTHTFIYIFIESGSQMDW